MSALGREGSELCIVGRVVERGHIARIVAALRASRFDLDQLSLFMSLEQVAPATDADALGTDHARDTLRAFGALGSTVIVSRAGPVLASGPLGRRAAARGELGASIAAMGLPGESIQQYERALAEGGSIVCVQTPDRGSMSQARRILAKFGALDIEVGLVALAPK